MEKAPLDHAPRVPPAGPRPPPARAGWLSRERVHALAPVAATLVVLHGCYLLVEPFLPAHPLPQRRGGARRGRRHRRHPRPGGARHAARSPYPILVGGRLRLHPLPVFFSIVGGLFVFGAAGVILGPLLLSVADALLDIWRRRTSAGRTADAAPGERAA